MRRIKLSEKEIRLIVCGLQVALNEDVLPDEVDVKFTNVLIKRLENPIKTKEKSDTQGTPQAVIDYARNVLKVNELDVDLIPKGKYQGRWNFKLISRNAQQLPEYFLHIFRRKESYTYEIVDK